MVWQTYKSIDNAAAGYANAVFQPTYAYDLDYAAGNTSMPGFTEMAALYSLYRVRGFKWSVQFVNADSATVADCCVQPLNLNPGINTANYVRYFSQRRGKQVLVGGSAGNNISRPIRGEASIEDFAGVKWTGQIDAYTGPTSGANAPSNIIYLFVGIWTSAAMTNGCLANVHLELDIDFFEVLAPPT